MRANIPEFIVSNNRRFKFHGIYDTEQELQDERTRLKDLYFFRKINHVSGRFILMTTLR